MNFDSDTNVIDVAIRRLRLKVDDEFETKLIHTVRGMGYKLEDNAANADSNESHKSTDSQTDLDSNLVSK
jgi:two-component system copper resistance phosphate regulon response regulator CusR